MNHKKQIQSQSPQPVRTGGLLQTRPILAVVGVFVMGKRIEYEKGEKVGTCYYLEDRPNNNLDKRVALFRCGYCGNEFECVIAGVKSGNSVSCGCYGRAARIRAKTKHGLNRHPVHEIWRKIKGRCLNENDSAYCYYGGRGITICKEWRNDFKAFYDYVTKLPNYDENNLGRKDGELTLDREDNDGHYEPDNMRWVTMHIQGLNQRRPYRANSGYTGVHLHKATGKYMAYIGVYGKLVRLGLFDTANDAIDARNGYITENNLMEYPIQKRGDRYAV